MAKSSPNVIQAAANTITIVIDRMSKIGELWMYLVSIVFLRGSPCVKLIGLSWTLGSHQVLTRLEVGRIDYLDRSLQSVNNLTISEIHLPEIP